MVSITPSVLRPVGLMSIPESESLSRRPTLIRKRDSTHLDIEGDAVPPNPGKRPKVTFDTDVDVRVLGEWEKGPELIREEVRRAIAKHAHGDNAGYDRVKEIFSVEPTSEDAPSPTTIRNYMLALLTNVASLNKSCSGLVHAVLESQWLGRDEDYLALYIRFLGTLVSAQGGFVGAALRILVENFTHRMCLHKLLSRVVLSLSSTACERATTQLSNHRPLSAIYSRTSRLEISPSAHSFSEWSRFSHPCSSLSTSYRLQKSTRRICAESPQGYPLRSGAKV